MHDRLSSEPRSIISAPRGTADSARFDDQAESSRVVSSFRTRLDAAADHHADAAPEISIILPVLNEAESLPRLIAQIEAALNGISHELIFVDDGSTDASWDLIQFAVADRPAWQAVRLTRRFGHQSALLAGLAAARGRAVITMDADGQHPPRLLPRMIEHWRTGARVVQTRRSDQTQAGLLKRLTSRGFYALFSRLCECNIKPGTADFRLLDRRVVDAILTMRGPTPFLRGLIPWLGFETVELPYEPSLRIGGTTKFSMRRMWRLAMDGLLSFSIVPIRLGIWTGLSIGILALIYLCYVAVVGIFSPAAVPGWASTAGLVALLGGVQLFCIGLLGEYLGRLYLGHLDRPRFVVGDSILPRPAQVSAPRATVDTRRADFIADRIPEAAHAG